MSEDHACVATVRHAVYEKRNEHGLNTAAHCDGRPATRHRVTLRLCYWTGAEAPYAGVDDYDYQTIELGDGLDYWIVSRYGSGHWDLRLVLKFFSQICMPMHNI